MLNRLKYFQELENYDESLLRSIDSTRTVIAAHTESLEEQVEQLTALKNVKEAEQETLRGEQRKHNDMLAKVRGEREVYERMVKELEEAQRELTLLLKSLQEKRTRVKVDSARVRLVAFEKRQGKLPWPVEGGVARPFGKIIHPVYKTVTMNTGIDIAAHKGAGVICVAPGRVDYVGWMRGYGKFVIVNHYGGYVTIYAHLDNIAVTVDQEVNYGTKLGVVGEGDIESGARVHFQIRKETEPLDPQQWLEMRQ
jgi:murein DD-endopeptidase MepM/ murein hydrolase activator NlpD